MRPPGWVRPLDDAGSPPASELVLSPIVCPHAAMSHALIEQAAAEVHPGCALVLGAGPCRDIPLAALARRFATIALIDEDAAVLAEATAPIAGLPGAALVTEICDLTGIAQTLIDAATACLADARTPGEAEAALCALIDGAEPRIACPPPAWDLVIASCVGTRLHLRALHDITRRYDARFPDGPALGASQVWTDAMLRLSWRLQDAWIAQLLERITPDGRLYLSDAVQVGVVYARLDGQWRTPGWYRMTRSRFLAELLPPDARLVDGRQWPYVAAAPSRETPGRVYNVHAAVLARRPG